MESSILHLGEKKTGRIIEALQQPDTMIAQSLDKLRPAEVPYRHAVKIFDNTPIYSKMRRMPERYNRIIKRELEMMMAARIIKPANCLCRFPVVIARKKDGNARFCIDYRASNKCMKANRFPLQKIEEVFDDLKGCNVFDKLDMFVGYW